MIHYRPTSGQPPENGEPGYDLSLYRERFAAVEALTSQIRKAKRAADESLRRALDAPEPHETTNTIFVALWETHLRDREALFAVMRRLDDAREELRRIVAGFGAKDRPTKPVGRQLAG